VRSNAAGVAQDQRSIEVRAVRGQRNGVHLAASPAGVPRKDPNFAACARLEPESALAFRLGDVAVVAPVPRPETTLVVDRRAANLAPLFVHNAAVHLRVSCRDDSDLFVTRLRDDRANLPRALHDHEFDLGVGKFAQDKPAVVVCGEEVLVPWIPHASNASAHATVPELRS